MKKTQFGMIGARSASLAAIAALGIGASLFSAIAQDARDYDRGPILIPRHKQKGLPPPPNLKAERRKMMAVRAMQERKRKQRQGLK